MNFDMQSMLAQAQKMQQEMERIKGDVQKKVVTADSGGGMVTVTMTCSNEIQKINIAKELIDPEEIEMLEDLIVAAINKATKKAADTVNEEMKSIGGMMPNIPGLNL